MSWRLSFSGKSGLFRTPAQMPQQFIATSVTRETAQSFTNHQIQPYRLRWADGIRDFITGFIWQKVRVSSYVNYSVLQHPAMFRLSFPAFLSLLVNKYVTNTTEKRLQSP